MYGDKIDVCMGIKTTRNQLIVTGEGHLLKY